MSKRSNGEGSIRQRADGRWEASLMVGGKRQYLYGESRSQVAEKLRTLTNQATQSGQLPSGGNLTLAEYLATWFDQAADHLRPTTRGDYATMIRLHIAPRIGHVRLARLTALQLAQHLHTLGKTLSKRRVRGVRDLLHKALGDAQKWGLVPTNVAALVDAPKRESAEPELWTPEQVRAFLAAMRDGKGGQYGNLFAFLAAAGCRLGEAVGLRWSDLDWQSGSVRLERQLTEVDGEFLESRPKTPAGVRSLVLPAFGLDALKRQKTQQAERRLRLGAKWTPSDRVFTSAVGTAPGRSGVRRALIQVCKRLGLLSLHPHSLRHLNLSLLAMAGVPVKVAQKRAGHATPTVTMQVYQHVLGDADHAAATAMERLLQERGEA